MILRYTNTVDDVAALIRFTTARSRTYRRNLRIAVAAIVLLGLVVLGGPGLLEGRWAALAGAALFMGVFVLFYRPVANRALARMARRLAVEQPNQCVLCEHTLEITPTGLAERTPVSEGVTAWVAIPRVEETDEHVFVYTQPHAAHVIPKARVEDGDVPAFLAALREKLPPAVTARP